MSSSSESCDRDESGDSIDSFLRLVAAETRPSEFTLVALSSGVVLGERFEIEALARRGGMGAIYRGIDRETRDAVAIKTIGRVTPAARSRFTREARILAELLHPRIVRYLSHGTTLEGEMYLVMEWLEGEDLAERLARSPLSIEESMVLVRRVCEGLAVAHTRGIVHRDIKPANLFLSNAEPRSVKLLDFGIARIPEATHALTTGGARIGTVGYMSPEQARGDDVVDSRTDVFALGCVLYECLTGKAPFTSAHAVGILAKVLQEEPTRPSELRPELDPRVDDLLSGLLAKSPKDRPSDAAAVLRALDGLGTIARRPGARARRSLSSRGAEQRIVSVILGRKGAASAVEVDEWLELVSEKYGARVTPLKGGAVLLALTGRGEANDRASQAALCALELCQRSAELILAVATGLADTSGSVPVGAAIDRAAALLSASGAVTAGVLLDDVTLGLVGLRFEVQRVGDANVLLAARRDLDSPRMLMGRPTPCVGRERELRALDEALNECVSDQVARAVIVTGPPGIGKSRLAAEWIGRGGHGGTVRTLFARPDPTSAGSAWSLVRLLLRDAAELKEAEARDAQRTRLGEYVAQLIGEPEAARVTEFLSEVVGLRGEAKDQSQLLQVARGNPEVMREQARRALHDWLDAEVLRQPILLVLEDVHWGDVPSVEFLASALREKAQRPLMLLVLARPEVERQFPELCERAELRVRLPGLGLRAAQQLVDAVLANPPDESTLTRLVRLTEGNPFYMEELIRRVAVGSTDWPDTVLAMAQSRIERLDSQSRCALRAASVFGERCWDSAIAAIVEERSDIDAVLSQLVREEILLAVPESCYAGAREYRFRHALFRDAAYAMLTNEDRCSAHGSAGEWLERNGEKDARLLADHYEAAGAPEKACPWLLCAAKKTFDAGDQLGTIELANRGAKLAVSGSDGLFLLFRAYAETLQGRPNLELARQALDLLATGTPPWWLALGVLIFVGNILGEPEKAAPYIALAREAPFTRVHDMPLGQGLITLVGGLVLRGQPAVAEAIIARARASEAETECEADPVFEAFLSASECALASVVPIAGRWQFERALHEGRRCAAALGSLGAFYGQSVVLMYQAMAAMHLGLHEEARDACVRSCAVACQASSVIRDDWPVLILARAYLRLGQPDAALKVLEPVRSSTDRTVLQMVPVIVAEIEVKLGNYPAAEAEVLRAYRGASPRLQRVAAGVLARAQLARGATHEALSTLEVATQSAQPPSGLESELELLNLHAECLLACGQHDSARRVAQRTRDSVLGLAADIVDPTLRHSFLHRVEGCARALALHEQLS